MNDVTRRQIHCLQRSCHIHSSLPLFTALDCHLHQARHALLILRNIIVTSLRLRARQCFAQTSYSATSGLSNPFLHCTIIIHRRFVSPRWIQSASAVPPSPRATLAATTRSPKGTASNAPAASSSRTRLLRETINTTNGTYPRSITDCTRLSKYSQIQVLQKPAVCAIGLARMMVDSRRTLGPSTTCAPFVRM